METAVVPKLYTTTICLINYLCGHIYMQELSDTRQLYGANTQFH